MKIKILLSFIITLVTSVSSAVGLFNNQQNMLVCMNQLGLFGAGRNVSSKPFIGARTYDDDLYLFSNRTVAKLNIQELKSKTISELLATCGVKKADGSVVLQLKSNILADSSINPTKVYISIDPTNISDDKTFNRYEFQSNYSGAKELLFPGECNVSMTDKWVGNDTLQTQVQVDILNRLLTYPQESARQLEAEESRFVRRQPNLASTVRPMIKEEMVKAINSCRATGNTSVVKQAKKALRDIARQGRAGAYRDGSKRIQSNPQYRIDESVE